MFGAGRSHYLAPARFRRPVGVKVIRCRVGLWWAAHMVCGETLDSWDTSWYTVIRTLAQAFTLHLAKCTDTAGDFIERSSQVATGKDGGFYTATIRIAYL